MSAGEKPHPATEQKLKKARLEGQVARSQTFTQSFQLLGVLLGFTASLHLFWSSPEMLIQYRGGTNLEDVAQFVVLWGEILVKTCLLTLLTGTAGTVMGECAQVGIKISFKPLNLDFKKVNPVTGTKKLFKGIKDLWLTFLKIFSGIGAAALIVSMYIYTVPMWVTYSPLMILSDLKNMFIRFGILTITLFACIALIERLYRKAEFLREQRMTHKEVKDEMKNNEGDPHIKGMQRALREQLAFAELPSRVRRSKVIIVQRAESRKRGSF